MVASVVHRTAIVAALLALTLTLHGCKSEEQAEKDFERTSPINAQKGEDKLEEEEAGLTDVENKNGLHVSELQMSQSQSAIKRGKTTESVVSAEKSNRLKVNRAGMSSLEVVGRAKVISLNKGVPKEDHPPVQADTTNHAKNVDHELQNLKTIMAQADQAEGQVSSAIGKWSNGAPQAVTAQASALSGAVSKAVSELEAQHHAVADSVAGVMKPSPSLVETSSSQQVIADENAAANAERLAHVISSHLAKAVDSHEAGSASAAHLVAEAAAGMSELREKSQGLRQAVEALGLDLGLHHADAKVKLQQVASDKHQVDLNAEKLDQQLEGIEHAHRQAPPKEMSEDDKFAELEKQTTHIMEWFNQLKQLRADRDKMKAKKDEAMKAAAGLGISPEDIQKELIQKGLDPAVVAANTKTA